MNLGIIVANASLVVPFALVAVVVAIGLLRVARWRPERVALLLAAVVVAVGLVAAAVRVADGIGDSRVEYRGSLDADEILSSFQPFGPSGLDDPAPRFEHQGVSYLKSADGVMSVPRAHGATLVLWSLSTLAPWLLAAIVLLLLFPVLRAAERGDPFRAGAARRLTWVGSLLLIGIPALALLDYLAADAAGSANSVAPTADPELTLTLIQLLPGVLVLVLAGVFRRGVELRELERHTV